MGNANTAVFIEKTYDMICRCDPMVACWNDTGDAFIVKDTAKLANMHIPRYFDHSNFSSFARQLNFYGFRKINNVQEDGFNSGHVRFYHEYFCRNRPELLSKIKRSTLGVSNSKLVNKEIETLKVTVSNLEEKIAKMTSDFEVKMREMHNIMQNHQRRQCNCSCGTIEEPVRQHKETSTKEVNSSPEPTHLSEPKLVKLIDINSPIIKREHGDVPISDITSISKENFERQQSMQSADFIRLINDDTFDDCVAGLPLSSFDPDQILSFIDRRRSTDSNALPPLPESLTRMPEKGIIRFLSDLSVSLEEKDGKKQKKTPDMTADADTIKN